MSVEDWKKVSGEFGVDDVETKLGELVSAAQKAGVPNEEIAKRLDAAATKIRGKNA